ncbi:hypothetical protein [Pseudomonas sp. H1h]|uniref:hypothetical protein n=1 Tax=Pseudomonas sp. H1h TaxID=1397280 RepID=UPI000468DB00|nr:hypothetical protein [Pseudomonas sp. H1h]
MSTINGVYRHEPSETTLTLTEGDDRTGSFTGTLSVSGIDYPLAFGNFHFRHGFSTGAVAIAFSTLMADGTGQAWVMFSPDQSYARLRAMGSAADLGGEVALTGLEFVRQAP